MGWRSLVIAGPAALDVENHALVVTQGGDRARVMLEDVSVVVLDHPQIHLTAPVLSACAEGQIAVVVVGPTHLPAGVLLPHHPHSRALRVMSAQIALGVPKRKRLHQRIVRSKICNQATVLDRAAHADVARRLRQLCVDVRSGDTTHREAQAAQAYFRALFGPQFSRGQARFYNAALNYGYAVVRAAIARTLTSYGFVPAFGLFHHSEVNGFNLADDLLESYRPLMDAHVLASFPQEPGRDLLPDDKGALVAVLHRDISLSEQSVESARCTLLAGIDATVAGLSRIVVDGAEHDGLPLPVLVASTPLASATADDMA